jgi:endonuclease/exonuclease/phosphatase family metal-dependent hydrolase
MSCGGGYAELGLDNRRCDGHYPRMLTTTSRLRALLLSLGATLLLAVTLTGTGGAAAAPPDERPGKPQTVMTRNIYLGANINRPINAALAAEAAGGTPQEVLVALANATHQTRAIVDRTNFPVRAGLLADEIVATRPSLVGLQEVAWWRHGPLQLGQVGVPNATETDYDFLQILLDALEERGESYEAVVVGTRGDVEAPSFTGTGSADARDVRLTMRDVILARADSGVRVTDTHDQIFDTNLTVAVAGVPMNFDRGYQWADVRSGGTSFRFVNTHLESVSSDLAYAQAAEVVGAAPADDRSTVFVCDCNSDPLDHRVKPIDTLPHSAPYELITQTFTDEWLRHAPAEEGWTSGLSETVDDPTGAGFDHRIDMIFGRTADGGPLAVDRGTTTGTSVDDRDPATGLWPSDHGGVVLRLRGL